MDKFKTMFSVVLINASTRFRTARFSMTNTQKMMKNGRKMELFTTTILFVLTHEGTCSRIQLETGDSRN